MGNRTSGSNIIHSCPPHHVRTVRGALKRYGPVGCDDQPGRLTLALSEAYNAEGTFSIGDATR
ncbi:hypothetical protein [Nocardia sp. NRRL S-836]|uniref:hypothetical protein n=1 Tax=Nocardia sp. NRRL S-836 TaxID=1519492 RepID=UPI0006AFEAFE|nr:hypothetical protein [Nocardia sp. NRRL S-836]KOV84631.1 hypothetical protein ADL03_15155 [Nocardia sp. NRRL S-836]